MSTSRPSPEPTPLDAEAEALTVLLVDDHAVVRDGLRLLLERQPDLRVVGQAGSVREAVAADLEPDPDVVVADLVLGDQRGPDVIASLRERYPRSEILALTMLDTPADVQLAFAAGARGYLLKESAAGDVVEAIRKVARGEDFLQPSLGAAIARVHSRQGRAPAAASVELSDREQQVLRLLALGHTNSEVGKILHLGLRTVEAHRASILRKLRLRTRAELAHYARQIGLVDSDGV